MGRIGALALIAAILVGTPKSAEASIKSICLDLLERAGIQSWNIPKAGYLYSVAPPYQTRMKIERVGSFQGRDNVTALHLGDSTFYYSFELEDHFILYHHEWHFYAKSPQEDLEFERGSNGFRYKWKKLGTWEHPISKTLHKNAWRLEVVGHPEVYQIYIKGIGVIFGTGFDGYFEYFLTDREISKLNHP
jgi:hypothetical protein